MKKSLKYFLIISAFFVFAYYFSNGNSPLTTSSSSAAITVSSGSADYQVYESLEELENNSDLIVKGKLYGEPTIQNIYQNGVHIDSVGKTEIKINDIFKGQVSEGTIIIVYEPGFVRDNILETMEGYVPMNKRGNYLLFLQENPKGEYVVMGVNQGKYDLSITKKATTYTSISKEKLEKVDYVGESPNRFNKMKNEVFEKYNE
ncbi:hypothetical protein [Bacillus sp. SG-1]|uniref:hypothetical protein n=1 Tax=Bacillus sp. SG-1 TaxID=161544 RepID=UPI0002FE273D|nr:hypothetical protein [Bacillus sp. SG-1]